MANSHLHSSEDGRSWDITRAGGGSLAPDFEESDLLQLAKAGNRTAFEVLYRQHAPRVEMICRARLRHDADVADAVQETFIRAFRHLGSFDGGPRFDHWLSRIARRVAIDIARKAHIRVEVSLDEAEDLDVAAEGPSVAVERVAVRSMLTSLSTRDARLLVSHHVDGHSVRELASQWGLTEGAMAVALQRARVRARAAAARQSLPAFVGVAVWRVINALRGRTRQLSLAAAVVPVVAAAIAVMPTIAPALGRPFEGRLEIRQSNRTAAGEAARSPERRRAEASQRRRQQRPETEAAEASPRVRARPGSSTAARGHRSAVVPLEPVAVPGTRGRVHTDRPKGEADYAFGVRAEHEENHAEARVEVFDHPEAEPAHDAACTAVEAAPDAVYCERGGDAATGP